VAWTVETSIRRAFKLHGCDAPGCEAKPDLVGGELPITEFHIDHIDPEDGPRLSNGRYDHAAVRNGDRSGEGIVMGLIGCQVLCTRHHNHKHGGSPGQQRLIDWEALPGSHGSTVGRQNPLFGEDA
jgi:hypothetical protein